MTQAALTIDYIDQRTKNELHLPITAFKTPSNDTEYLRLEKILDKLIDEVRDNEKHALSIAMQIIGDNLERYDDEHHAVIGEGVSDIEMVKYLMKSHKLHQVDLSDIFGNQANVSKFLNGERKLSKRQIYKLKKRFGISADFFI